MRLRKILSLLAVTLVLLLSVGITVLAEEQATDLVVAMEVEAAAAEVAEEMVETSAQPNATVSVLAPLTLTKAEHSYMVWPSGDATIDRPLEIVMNFKTNETVEEARPNGFLPWKVDFNLKFTGLANGKITADNSYLAGNYGDFGWIVIPTDGMEIEEGVSYPVVAAYDANITYKQICEDVKNFTAAIHVDQEILDANPNFKVELTLVMTNPDDENDKFIVGEPAVFNAKDLRSEIDTTTAHIRNKIVATSGGNIENEADKRYQVRFLSGIDSLNYKKVGFEVTVNGETRVIDTKTVYTKFTAANGDFVPSDFNGENGECNYIFSLSINFPYTDEYKNASVAVKPFAVSKKGNTLWGPEKIIDKIYNQ